jgi:uncharacterized integral membrane protein
MVDSPGDVPVRPDHDTRRRRRLRALGALAVVVVAVVFVVQNSQRVTVRLWFVTGHVRLIWLIVACLVVAGVFGFALGRGRRRRAGRRPRAD